MTTRKLPSPHLWCRGNRTKWEQRTHKHAPQNRIKHGLANVQRKTQLSPRQVEALKTPAALYAKTLGMQFRPSIQGQGSTDRRICSKRSSSNLAPSPHSSVIAIVVSFFFLAILTRGQPRVKEPRPDRPSGSARPKDLEARQPAHLKKVSNHHGWH